MRDFSALREAVARKGYSDLDVRALDEFLTGHPCQYNHRDPPMDCFWTTCEHIREFGCGCVKCNEEHALDPYSESPQEHDSAFEEADSIQSMEEDDYRDD